MLQQLRSARLYPTLAAPEFNRHGGEVPPGFSLSISLPGGGDGTIYYSIDGSDPRTYGSGELSASASAYSEPLRITQNTAVLARTRSGETWSALNAARFSVPATWSALAITEIMYHAPGGNAYDFIELANLGDSALDLGGLSFTSGISFEFPEGSALAAGGFLVLAADDDAFSTAYPAAEPFGAYGGSLANEGESIRLEDRFGNTAALVDYEDSGRWPLGPDGFGYSLVPLRPGSVTEGPESWRASAAAFGSPGTLDPEPRHHGVIINEVLSHSDSPLELSLIHI